MQYGVCLIAHGLLCRETHAPTLLARKTRTLRHETGNDALQSRLHDGLDTQERVARAVVRPLKLLLLNPIVLLMSLYCAVVYGILYLLYTTFTFVFEQSYGFSSGTVGLTYIASGIGMFIGLFIIGGSSDRLLQRMAAKYGGEMKPEYRLLPLLYTGWLAPVGWVGRLLGVAIELTSDDRLFIYGWTIEYHEQWWVDVRYAG